ncbi:MAG: aminotransferase class V-fold PLP-dependent enzyme [Holophagales bacterium]|nr:aminotransferase class V-fold PLP-dependent enzyme [Holophagales bacterium]
MGEPRQKHDRARLQPSAIPRSLAEVLALFEPGEKRRYLDSATYGLPPRTTVEALERAARAWQSGEARWKEDWDLEGEACRRRLAELLGAQVREISLQPAVSVASGIVATAVPEGGEVLLAQEDFTSVTYPFLAARDAGRIEVRSVPFDRLTESITPRTSMVAVSLVQSADGRLADARGLRQATRRVGALLYLDASQALGSYPVDVGELEVDFLSCAAYKWLCCPRGVAFLYVRRDLWQAAWPVAASWRGGDDPWGRYYGTELHLAPDAARFDVSLAWHAWAGARHSLDVLCALDADTRFRLGHGPARRFAHLLELPEPGTAIVAVPVRDGAAAARALDAEGIRASVRSGGLRLSFHLYNTSEDAEAAASVIRPFLA